MRGELPLSALTLFGVFVGSFLPVFLDPSGVRVFSFYSHDTVK